MNREELKERLSIILRDSPRELRALGSSRAIREETAERVIELFETLATAQVTSNGERERMPSETECSIAPEPLPTPQATRQDDIYLDWCFWQVDFPDGMVIRDIWAANEGSAICHAMDDRRAGRNGFHGN